MTSLCKIFIMVLYKRVSSSVGKASAQSAIVGKMQILNVLLVANEVVEDV